MPAEYRIVPIEDVTIGNKQHPFDAYLDQCLNAVDEAQGKEKKARVVDQLSTPLLRAFLSHGMDGFHTLRSVTEGLEGSDNPRLERKAAFLKDVIAPARIATTFPRTDEIFDYFLRPETERHAQENINYLNAMINTPLDRFQALVRTIKRPKNDPQRDTDIVELAREATTQTADTLIGIMGGLIRQAEKNEHHPLTPNEQLVGRAMLERLSNDFAATESTGLLALINLAIADERILADESRDEVLKKLLYATFLVQTANIETQGVVASPERTMYRAIQGPHAIPLMNVLRLYGYKGYQLSPMIQQETIDTYFGPYRAIRSHIEQELTEGELHGHDHISLDDQTDSQVAHKMLGTFVNTAFTNLKLNHHPAFARDETALSRINIMPGESELLLAWTAPSGWEANRVAYRSALHSRTKRLLETYPIGPQEEGDVPTGKRRVDRLEGHALGTLFMGLGPDWLHGMGCGFQTEADSNEYFRQVKLAETKRVNIQKQGKFLRREGQFIGEESLPASLKNLGLERIDYHIGHGDNAVRAVLRFKGAEGTKRDSSTGAITGLHAIVNLDKDFRIIGHDFLKAQYKVVYEYLQTVLVTGLEAIRRKKIDRNEGETPPEQPQAVNESKKEKGSNVDHLEVLPLGYRADTQRVLELDRNERLIEQCRGIYGIVHEEQLPWDHEKQRWTDIPPLAQLIGDFVALQEGMTTMEELYRRDPISAAQIQGFLDTIANRPERESDRVYEAQLFLQQKIPTEPTEVYCREDMNILETV